MVAACALGIARRTNERMRTFYFPIPSTEQVAMTAAALVCVGLPVVLWVQLDVVAQAAGLSRDVLFARSGLLRVVVAAVPGIALAAAAFTIAWLRVRLGTRLTIGPDHVVLQAPAWAPWKRDVRTVRVEANEVRKLRLVRIRRGLARPMGLVIETDRMSLPVNVEHAALVGEPAPAAASPKTDWETRPIVAALRGALTAAPAPSVTSAAGPE